MPRFEPPGWASPPQSRVSLEADGNTIRIDERRHYVVGRGAEFEGVDILFEDESLSRHHAAIVHHTTGKVYIIDLHTTHGTFLDGVQLEKNKPKKLLNGSKLVFGALDRTFTVTLDETKMYKASHLLVKHKDVRNPKSWKEAVVTRTEEEALAKIQAFHSQLTSGDPATLPQRFAELASQESHCSSAKRGGDLGEFGPGQMQKPFEDGVAALQVGELSGPVFTASGVHLILRTQ